MLSFVKEIRCGVRTCVKVICCGVRTFCSRSFVVKVLSHLSRSFVVKALSHFVQGHLLWQCYHMLCYSLTYLSWSHEIIDNRMNNVYVTNLRYSKSISDYLRMKCKGNRSYWYIIELSHCRYIFMIPYSVKWPTSFFIELPFICWSLDKIASTNYIQIFGFTMPWIEPGTSKTIGANALATSYTVLGSYHVKRWTLQNMNRGRRLNTTRPNMKCLIH